MNHVKTILETFGQHTRQNDEELLDTSKIAQKYLAVHIGGVVPTELAYNCISNDYNAMRLRTHNPPLATYAKYGKVDVPTFLHVMGRVRQQQNGNESLPIFSDIFRKIFQLRDRICFYIKLQVPLAMIFNATNVQKKEE